ncbi:MAG: carboxypeptidase-like regulatory domain-containing protein [Candidatus Micrarchaeota archaeon]
MLNKKILALFVALAVVFVLVVIPSNALSVLWTYVQYNSSSGMVDYILSIPIENYEAIELGDPPILFISSDGGSSWQELSWGIDYSAYGVMYWLQPGYGYGNASGYGYGYDYGPFPGGFDHMFYYPGTYGTAYAYGDLFEGYGYGYPDGELVVSGTINTSNYAPGTYRIRAAFIVTTLDGEHAFYSDEEIFTIPGGNNNGGQSDPELSIEFETDCYNHTIIVTSGNNLISNAKVVVNGDTIGYTDENGEIEFEGCTDSVIIRATKSGYDSALYKEDLDCDCSESGQEEPDCTTDQNCAYNEVCTSGECTPITCDCGTIQDHECVSYECCSDSECSTGYSCISNTCEQTPEDECSTDADCAETQYCSNGSCLEVTGDCGYIANHAFVAYECGTDANCPTCTDGLCINNECVANDLTCEDGLVGGTANCAATEDNAPCANCEYEVTTPDGQTLTGTTDENGNFNLPLNLVGTYTVSLIKGGVEVSSTEVTSSQTTVVDDDKPPVVGSDPMQFIFLAVILLLLAAIVIYWYSTRGKKSKHK